MSRCTSTFLLVTIQPDYFTDLDIEKPHPKLLTITRHNHLHLPKSIARRNAYDLEWKLPMRRCGVHPPIPHPGALPDLRMQHLP
jgi:hypothetical protein